MMRFVLALTLTAALVTGIACRDTTPPPPPPAPEPVEPPPPPAPVFEDTRYELEKRDTLGKLFERAGFTAAQTHAMVEAMRPLVDPRKVRPGQALVVTRDEGGAVVKASWQTSFIDVVDLTLEGTTWTAARREVVLDTEVKAVTVSITSSLWDAFVSAGEDPTLAVLASDVLAWEVDFYRDVRADDRLDLLVEKISHEGRFVKYGDLRAVRYDGHVGRHEFFRFEHDGTTGWYARDGSSARRAFLKQPLPLVRITSKFGGRKHPVLGYYKQHAGVDYGAPTGTPVWAVGDGVVTWAAYKGANGNLVSIRHSNGYTSHYAHLSRISSDVKKGRRVTQKQVIGQVGTTGRSTGPHLHFALSKEGTFVNPLTLRFPSGTPLPTAHRAAFDELTAALAPELEQARALAADVDVDASPVEAN